MYAIICDSRKGSRFGIDTLALVDRRKSKRMFWTTDAAHLIKKFSCIEDARECLAKIAHNNPCVANFKTACEMIERQAQSIGDEIANMEDGIGWDSHK